MVKKVLLIAGVFQVILSAMLSMTAWADNNPFTNLQNGRDLIQQANQRGYSIEFRYFQARTLSQFDRISNVRVSGRLIYADWVNTFRIPDYVRPALGKIKTEVDIETLKTEFETSNIKLEIHYVVTKNMDLYGKIYQQNPLPGTIVTAKSLAFKSPQPTYNPFKKPQLIGGTRNSYSGYAAPHSHYSPTDTAGNIVLRLSVFTIEPAEMIDLTGLTFQEAKARLASIGIPVGYIQDIYEKTYQKNLYGKIFKQTIPPGTILTRPQIMGVVIYAFPETKMPDLTRGWTLEKAKQEPYLTIVPNFLQTNDIALDGLIFEQNIRAGTPLIRRTSVVVKAYKYEDPFFRPDYIGMNQDDAIKKLNEKNLRYAIDIKDIFEHFKSTFDLDFIRKNDNTVVDAKRMDGKIILTIVKFTPKSDSMPDLLGKDCQAAIKELIILKKAIPGMTYTTEYIPTPLFINSGKVVKTQPAAFAEVNAYDAVKLFCGQYTTTDLSSVLAVVPDLRGMTEADARRELTNLGFLSFKTIKEKKVGAVEGTVVDITGNIEVSSIGYEKHKAETLQLYIADSNGTDMPEMLHLVSRTPENAKEILLREGFRRIIFEDEASSFVKYISTLPAGVIIATSPRAGHKCVYGLDTSVYLTVRLKPGQVLPENINLTPPQKADTVRVPPLQATLADTLKIMEKNDLIPQANYEVTKFAHFKDKLKPGSVPAWNTLVKRGSKVSFTVYTLKAVVPPVTIFDEKTAVKLIEKNNLKASVSYLPTDIKSQDSQVFSQEPSGGVLLKPGSTVKLMVSQFSGMTTIPNILFRQYEPSVTKLLTEYFNLSHKVVEIPTQFEEDDGKIFKTTPAAGTKLKEGTVVMLHVYKVAADAPRLLPNVRYLSLEEAKKLLSQKGFVTRTTDVITDSVSLAGRVASQIPASGSRLNPGATITLSVNAYSGMVIVPNLINQDLDASLKRSIEQKGLFFTIIEGEKKVLERNLAGRIYRTQPEPNSKVKKGTTITLYVYTLLEESSQVSSMTISMIKDFYTRFKDAYESKDESQVVSLISDTWGSNDGNSITDLEENLHNIFSVFDEIQYNISNLSVQTHQDNTFLVSYTVTIKGTIFESGITHNEKSSVNELVKLENNTFKIIKTLNGNFWSIK